MDAHFIVKLFYFSTGYFSFYTGNIQLHITLENQPVRSQEQLYKLFSWNCQLVFDSINKQNRKWLSKDNTGT